MRYDKYKTFPYPVLRPGSDDYVDAEFQATIEFSVDGSDISVKVSYDLSSDEIKAQIAQGNAEYVCVISSRETYHQTVLKSSTPSCEARFDVGSLRGEVMVDSYVIVRKPVNGFISKSINSEYGFGPFSFDIGDVMAQEETYFCYLERDAFRSLTSVFELVKRDNLSDGEWRLAFDEDHVKIEVSQRMKESIDDARNDNRNKIILKNSIYFAAVMQAVQNLNLPGDEYGSRKWAMVIRRQAHNKGVDLRGDDAYVITQQLMQHPILQLDRLVFNGDR